MSSIQYYQCWYEDEKTTKKLKLKRSGSEREKALAPKHIMYMTITNVNN